MRTKLLSLVLCIAVVGVRAETPPRHFDGHSWWSHIGVLADDNMEGRQTGSDGLRRAQAYVVEQLKRSGIQPAGVDGFYQPIHFLQHQIDEGQSSAALLHDGTAEPIDLGGDAYFGTKVDGGANEISAPLVFVGNGLRVPENNLDDLAGLDVKGKVVVLLAGSPAAVSAALTGHYSSTGERWEMLRTAGAIGMITIPNPASMDIPWIRMTANRAAVSMDLDDPEFNEVAGLKVAMTFNPAQAEKLFAGSGHTFREIAILGKDRAVLPHFPLAVTLKAHAVIRESRVESANLVALLPGRDPKLKDECVVLSAHVDHVGIGAAINGDKIYNGAMDDASGVALLLDLAADFKARGEKLARSVLFVFVTAEEKGLLGSKYFASHPTVPVKSMIADVNFDMFLPIVPLKVLKVAGLAESDLGDRTREAAERFGIRVQPDPEPLRNTFIRSDQYNFIRQGIPAVKIDFGFDPGSADQKVLKDWLTSRYHAPSDDLAQPVDLASAALYEDILRSLVVQLANDSAQPRWKADSFFRRYGTK